MVPQLVHRRHSHRCRLQRPVVALLRRPRSAVHRVTGSHQLPLVVRAVCVHRPPGVVENIVCQNVVVCVVGPVIAVVPVFRLSSHQVVHLDHSAYCYAGIRRRRCDFPHGPHLAVPVLQLHPVLRLRVIHIPHPRIQRSRRILCVHSVLRQHTLPTAHLQQLSSAVAQAVHASRRVRHAGQVLAAVIPQARHRDFRSAPILLHNLVDSVPGAARVSVGVLAPVAVDVPDLKLIPVGILHHRQKSVYKILRVVPIVRHFVVVRLILVDLQSQAVLIVVIPVLLLLVLGKVVHRSVSVCVLQIRRRFSRLHIVLQLHLFHLLHHVQVYSGSQVHSVSQPAAHVVILRPVLLRIAAVVHQLQTERVHRGCVRSQLLAHRHLSRIIRQVHRSSVPHSVRLIRIIRLDPVGAPVRHHKRHPVIREPRTAFVRRRCVGRQRQSVVAAPVLVPLLCRRCDVPQKNIPDGMVAGVHIVQRRSVGRPVRPAQAAVQILVLRIGVHVQHHLSLRAVAAGSPIVLIQSGIRPHQRMPRRYLRVLVQLEVHLRLLVVPVVSAQDLSSGHGVIHPLGTHRPLKVRFLRLVDQRRIDRHREYSLLCFQPAFLRCHRQHPAAVFLLLQLIPHRLRIRPCPVRHVRRRHPVRGVSFRILQHHRPVLLQRRRQSLQTQPEGEGVSSRQPLLHHNGLLHMVAVQLILQVHPGVHFLIPHLCPQPGRCNLLAQVCRLACFGAPFCRHPLDPAGLSVRIADLGHRIPVVGRMRFLPFLLRRPFQFLGLRRLRRRFRDGFLRAFRFGNLCPSGVLRLCFRLLHRLCHGFRNRLLYCLRLLRTGNLSQRVELRHCFRFRLSLRCGFQSGFLAGNRRLCRRALCRLLRLFQRLRLLNCFLRLVGIRRCGGLCSHGLFRLRLSCFLPQRQAHAYFPCLGGKHIAPARLPAKLRLSSPFSARYCTTGLHAPSSASPTLGA